MATEEPKPVISNQLMGPEANSNGKGGTKNFLQIIDSTTSIISMLLIVK
jgi:hypothetical protein